MAEDKKFKPHMMYSKAGKGQMAFTKKKHLDLKAKGHTHIKPKAKELVQKHKDLILKHLLSQELILDVYLLQQGLQE
jgi:hypothetical protein